VESTYQILLYSLFTLAAIDLIVGVSNDAVNFLNSAIGSKVAHVRTILIVASLGILIGTTFSSGLMEVARKGVFVPSFFTFETIMMIFMAVMLTDIVLLDVFNSIGLPTSTTVSIVFELLGSAFAIGILHSFSQDINGFENFGSFLNFDSALKIISGIFLSIFFAFTIGALVQYITRLLFTFNLKKGLSKYGSIFSGMAITAITYFLIIKGLKGSSFIAPEQMDWVKQHTLDIVLVSAIFWSLAAFIVMRFLKLNPLKLIVLLGTFSLAMAFAGNDLVNFIGVGVAAWQSFNFWQDSGLPADQFTMEVLEQSIQTPTILLLAAGVIMIVTLWLSSKARRVTETEVNLGRQDAGEERFKPNFISRQIVGFSLRANASFRAVLSNEIIQRIDKSFEKYEVDALPEEDNPAFDLLRAAVNLTMASILIAYATSLKLPLSTTYVSFMVAMGTSLADRAWGKDSAVYRVAGVINVILGWLMTALVAFVSAGIMGTILYFTGFYGVIGLTVFAGIALTHSHFTFKRKQREEAQERFEYGTEEIKFEAALEKSREITVDSLNNLEKVLILTLKSMIGNNRDILMETVSRMKSLQKRSDKVQTKVLKQIKQMPDGNIELGRLYLLVYDLLQDLNQSSGLLVKTCNDHVMNYHGQPGREFLDLMIELEQRLRRYLSKIEKAVETMDFADYQPYLEQKRALLQFINENLDQQIAALQKGQLSSRFANLQTRILLEFKDVIAASARVLKLYHEFSKDFVAKNN
jgi:hypothetical protein